MGLVFLGPAFPGLNLECLPLYDCCGINSKGSQLPRMRIQVGGLFSRRSFLAGFGQRSRRFIALLKYTTQNDRLAAMKKEIRRFSDQLAVIGNQVFLDAQ